MDVDAQKLFTLVDAAYNQLLIISRLPINHPIPTAKRYWQLQST
ncbi:hypothetical protein Nizo2814_0801 [Lactiplantibacillus plantarum]|nr:hypothetical protein Nizo2814_0801 [Lactiplantibacillus plantarum]